MKNEDIIAILDVLGMTLSRARPDIPIAGSPERSLERTVVEDGEGRPWVIERLDPLTLGRKKEIASVVAFLGGRLPEVKPYLAFAPGRFIAEREGGAWQVAPYVAGIPLERPEFAFEAWRGDVLADLLVRFRKVARDMPGREPPKAFSLAFFVRDLLRNLRIRERALLDRVYPAVLHLEKGLFAKEDALPQTFSHGDFHPLNMIWSATGVSALVDWEFCGLRPEMYDAALLVGCIGMEDPRSLSGGLARALISGLRSRAGYAEAGWETFFELVLAVRFAWLSDWLRRTDREMIDLEAVFIGWLLENREVLAKAWG
jgi:homoserine kinase type II